LSDLQVAEKEADISASIGKVNLGTCVFNAAGPNDVTQEQLMIIGRSKCSAITMKSCTLEPREGNPEPRYYDLQEGSINSSGLPNIGYKQYVKFTRILENLFPKPIVASVSGLSFNDNITIIEAFNNSAADLIELNLSCPNIIGKPQTGYDFEATDRLLKEVTKACKKPLGLKLPPYFDFVHQEQMAEIVKKYNITYLSCINSVGNTLVIDPEAEKPVIKPKGGFGGLGGKYIKPIALANTRKFYELLGDKLQIVGCGGIFTGKDAFEFILAGASAVQLGTVYIQEGPECFERIQQELRNYMKKKGYKNLDDFRGKLKHL